MPFCDDKYSHFKNYLDFGYVNMLVKHRVSMLAMLKNSQNKSRRRFVLLTFFRVVFTCGCFRKGALIENLPNCDSCSIMSMNLPSIRDRVAFRVGHVSVAYKGTVLLWGGHKVYLGNGGLYDEYIFRTDELCIFDCYNETWHIRMLSGDIPRKMTSPGAAVLGDALYVFGGFIFGPVGDPEDGEDLYRLDLTNMKWQKLNPTGIRPIACNKIAAWSYGNKVYFFGGFGKIPPSRSTGFDYVVDNQTGKAWNNQLVAYNPELDRWEWPPTSGAAPNPRAAHACDISGAQVFIMGGRVLDVRMEELYCLNMETMTWSENLTPVSPDEPKPEGRSWHTLTFFAPDKAVVYGGYNTDAETLDDCWIVETESPVRNAPVRFRLFNSFFDSKRFWHKSVYNPITGDLICTGGTAVRMDNTHYDPPHIPRYKGRCAYFEDNVPGFILMSFQPKSLLRLSVDAVLESRERTKPFWNELPVKLRDLLRTREACD